MPQKPSGSPQYYYADNKRISLQPADDLVAFKAKPASGRKGAVPVGRELTGGLRLAAKGDLTPAKRKLTSNSNYPVYRSGGAIVVALPEVRVEESRRSYWTKLQKWLVEHGDVIEVVSSDDERVVLRPASGSGRDALSIANNLAETVHPEMAQARFIRVVPRPTA